MKTADIKHYRPVLDLPKTPLAYLLDAAAVILLGIIWIVVGTAYSTLPETIPVHFNTHGEPDGTGGRATTLFIPVLATVMTFGLILLNRIPHRFNYLVKITPENAEFEYRKGQLLLRVVNILTNGLFLYITWEIIEGARTGSSKLGAGFFVLLLANMIAPLGILAFSKKR